jgi:hypothetical protein
MLWRAFGSLARGELGGTLSYLAARLTQALGRDVEVLSLAHVRAHDPALARSTSTIAPT